MSKYKNVKVTVDGNKFDSKLEADYYLYLKQLKESGEITDFELQPKFELLEKFEKNGKKFRATNYKADFKVFYNDGTVEIVDVKGMQTPLFKLKRKMFENKFPFELKLVTYVKKWGGWIELDELERLRKENKKKKNKPKQ